MLRAVIFDLDQTLLDRAATFHRFLEKQYLRFQRDLQAVSLTEYTATVQSYDSNGYTPKSDVYTQVCADLSLGLSKELYTDFKEVYGQEPVLFGDTVTVLEALAARYKLGLITNGRSTGQNAKIDGAGLRRFFDAIKISEEEGVKKPSPVIFERCLEQLGVPPAQAVYIGDHPRKDVVAAQQVGLKGIWVRSRNYTAPESADGIIDNLGELLDLLASPNLLASPSFCQAL